MALLATVLENSLLELLEVVGDLVALRDLTELGVRDVLARAGQTGA